AREFRAPQIPRRFWGGVAFFALAILVFIAASPIISFFTEVEWYDSLGLRDVYLTRLGLEWSIALGTFVLALLYLGVNVAIALRIRSGGPLRAVGIRRSAVRSPAGRVTLGAAAVIAAILPPGAAKQLQSVPLLPHSSPTGTTDSLLRPGRVLLPADPSLRPQRDQLVAGPRLH